MTRILNISRPELNAALSYTDRTEGGRPPFDPVIKTSLNHATEIATKRDCYHKRAVQQSVQPFQICSLGWDIGFHDQLPFKRTPRAFWAMKAGVLGPAITSNSQARTKSRT